jgi:hypothetical protein
MDNEQEYDITYAEHAIIHLWRYMQGLYRFCDYPGCSLPPSIEEEYKQKMLKELEKENSTQPWTWLVFERYDGEFKDINKWLKKHDLPQIEGIKKQKKEKLKGGNDYGKD